MTKERQAELQVLCDTTGLIPANIVREMLEDYKHLNDVLLISTTENLRMKIALSDCLGAIEPTEYPLLVMRLEDLVK